MNPDLNLLDFSVNDCYHRVIIIIFMLPKAGKHRHTAHQFRQKLNVFLVEGKKEFARIDGRISASNTRKMYIQTRLHGARRSPTNRSLLKTYEKPIKTENEGKHALLRCAQTYANE